RPRRHEGREAARGSEQAERAVLPRLVELGARGGDEEGEELERLVLGQRQGGRGVGHRRRISRPPSRARPPAYPAAPAQGPTLTPVNRLVVDVAVDNLSDSYSSKPPNVSPEFNNVIAAGARELSGRTLCCAQLGLSLVLTAERAGRRHTLLFDAGPEGAVFLRNCRNLGVSLIDVAAIAV